MRALAQLWLLFANLLSFAMLWHGARVDARERRPLVLISLDGCRWDYLTRGNFPALATFRREGASAEWAQGTFPTKTFPSHNAIVTGRYHEDHGIIGNAMFDLDTGKVFKVGPMALDPYFWDYNSTRPIWVSAVRQSIKSGVYFWPGSEIPRDGTLPTAVIKYNQSAPLSARFAQLVDWLANDGYGLVLMYFHEPDNTGHWEGPDSPNIVNVLQQIDLEFGRFVDALKAKGLYDKVDIVITGDHGMGRIDTTYYIDNFGVDGDKDLMVIETTPNLNAFVNNASNWPTILKRLNTIPNVHVYRRDDIPEHWHYKRNRRVPDILIVPDIGYSVSTLSRPELIKGTHGYDNAIPEMRTIFMARGPSFRAGYRKTGGVLQIDIYSLICDVLQLKCEPHDGDLRRMSDLLSYSTGAGTSAHLSPLLLIVIAALSLAAKLGFGC